MTQRKIPPCPSGLRPTNRPAIPLVQSIDCDPTPGTVWEVLSPSGEIFRVVVVEYYTGGEESPFAFSRCIAISRFIGTTGPRDTFVELEPAEELAVAHCWLEGPIREVLLKRCVAIVSAESLRRIEENREPFAVTDLPTQVASFRKSLRQQLNVVFRDSWRELYEILESEEDDQETEPSSQLTELEKIPQTATLGSAFNMVEVVRGTPEQESRHQFALAFEERSADPLFREVPERRWKKISIPPNSLHWIEGKPSPGDLHAEVEVEWLASGTLVVLTNGLIQRGRQYVVEVAWTSSTGRIIDKATSSYVRVSKPICLQSANKVGPKKGDALDIVHSWLPGGPKIWRCSLQLKF